MRRDTARRRLAWRLRMVADRISPDTGPRHIGWSYTHERGEVWFNQKGRGTPLWAMAEDYDRAHDEAETEHIVVLWGNVNAGREPRTRWAGGQS